MAAGTTRKKSAASARAHTRKSKNKSSIPFLLSGGVMNTSDEETLRFFKHSSVQVLLCPRSAGKGHSWVKKQVSSAARWSARETLQIVVRVGGFSAMVVVGMAVTGVAVLYATFYVWLGVYVVVLFLGAKGRLGVKNALTIHL